MPQYDFDFQKLRRTTGKTIIRCIEFIIDSMPERSKFNQSRKAVNQEKNTTPRSKNKTIHLGK
jgi:hypothetical protein